jgi:lysyl-tRNA synthetase class 2
MSFIEENDQTEARREHLTRITELVGDAYPTKFVRSRIVTSQTDDTDTPQMDDTVTSVYDRYIHLAPKPAEGERPTPEQLAEANATLNLIKGIRIAGRLAVPPRVMGKAAFVHLSDGNKRLQIYVRKDEARGVASDGREVDGWQLFGLLDHGDFIGVEGYSLRHKDGRTFGACASSSFSRKLCCRCPTSCTASATPKSASANATQTSSRAASKLTRATRATRRRNSANLPRAKSLNAARKSSARCAAFGRARLHRSRDADAHAHRFGRGGASFKTHHNALDIDLYARIAPELYLKRLLVGGFERVYELNRNFRNEGISTRHNPEFTMLEFYAAYMDVNGMMDFCEEMIRSTVQKATGGTTIRYGEIEIDFEQPFKRLSMKQAIVEYMPSFLKNIEGNRFSDETWLNDPKRIRQMFRAMQLGKQEEGTFITMPFASDAEVKTQRLIAVTAAWEQYRELILAAGNGETDEAITGKLIAYIFEEVAEGYYREEGYYIQPTFITDFPKPISPLSKASFNNPSVAERFELYIAGMECANGFSELNDPVEQEARFKDQQAQRERGDDEAMQMDADYLHALAYGMPPAAGIGIGIDRLVMLLTNRRSIRDVILFPHLRPRASEREDSAESSENQN